MTSISDIQALIVDDNEQMLRLLRGVLRAAGLVNLHVAESVAAARDIKRHRNIDLILLDWKMAPIDGLSFARELRRDSGSGNPYVPIVMLTAHTEASRVLAARDAGVSCFIKKPISTQLLIDRLTFALTDHRCFIRTEDFIGPDRRHCVNPHYRGPHRREDDHCNEPRDTFDLDDAVVSL